MRLKITVLALLVFSVLALPQVSAFCNSGYSISYPITNLDNNSNPFLVNDTYGVDFGDGPQYIWCNATSNYLCYNNSAYYSCFFGDTQMPTFIDEGNGTNYGSPESALQLWLHMNGTDVHDLSLYQVPLNISNQVSETDGKIGGGLDFDGTDDYIDLGNDAYEQQTITLMSWFKYDAASADFEDIFSTSGSRLAIGINGSGYLKTTHYTGAGGCDSEFLYAAEGTLTTDTWYHVALVTDGTANTFKSFFNGVIIEDVSSCGPIIFYDDGNIYTRIGYGYSNYFNGSIDELRVYNRTLSEAEIAAIYNNTKPDGYSTLGDPLYDGTSPYYTNVTEATPTSPQTYLNVMPLEFNVSYYDDDGYTDYVYVHHNFSGSFAEVNMTNYTANDWNLTYNITFMAGYFEYRYCGMDNESHSNCTSYYNYTIDQAASAVTISSSPGWTSAEDTQINISCSANAPLTTNLTRDGVLVSEPYSATFDFGTYLFVCTVVGDVANYTPATASNTLNIVSGGFGCTDNLTFAFEANFTVNTSASNQTVVDLSSLVNDYLVSSDLSDVYPVTNNSPTGWKNGSLFIANVTGHSTLTLRFGNAAFNRTYADADNTTDQTAMTYSEINPYMRLTFTDERTGTVQLPPESNRTLFIFCDSGTSLVNISNRYMTIATFEQADEIKARVSYSATEIYMRNYVISSDAETKNVYLVDADQDQVVQMIISLQDATGDFNDALLKAKKHVEGTLRTITEHYFDAEDKVIIYLINGDKYSIYIDNGVEERSIGDFEVDSVDLTKTLSIGEVLVQNRTLGNLTFRLFNTTDQIEFSYIDESGLTSSVEMYVYWANDTQLYYTNSTNRSRIDFVYTVPNVSVRYKVNVLVHHHTFGLNTLDLWYVYFGGHEAPFPYPVFNPLSGTIEGFGDSEEESWQNFVGVLAVIGAAMLFTAAAGAIGGVFAVIVGVVLVLFGWWENSTVLLGIALILAVINQLNKGREVNRT